ncbi:hypothetical protein [uncultured Dokdonia sp.]|uniref:hypothetical protein n=1 Tax=uncultured Dokdonia sp. TaxID=575653 RepID=UPI002638EC21|nr:hypothetical protein [uncultured Dokdonia sp.]
MIQQLKKLVFFVFIITAIACERDDTIIDPEVISPTIDTPSLEGFSDNFGAEITRSFIGTIINSNRQPIDGVQITIGSSATTTDSNGVFILNDVTVNERFAYVKTFKNGYIHGSRSLVPTEGINKVTIMLLEETIAGTTSSGTSETISLSNGASVTLNGDYVKEDGSPYQGTVDVILHHLDPTNPEVNEQMPGMLYAANANGEERLLQTLGMLAVELRGANGEDLNLADGTSAEIRVPVDASLLSTAPSTIPLWYFDEDGGYWIEDGEATLIGSEYVGTVTHFSFWNCDIPAESVILCVYLTTETAEPISNILLEVTSQNFGTQNGVTNSLGVACGFVPSNEALLLSGQFYCSGELISFSENIPPLTENTTINITPTYNNVETVTGTFTTCNGDPITNGYVLLTYDDETYIDAVTDGTYTISFISCENEAMFTIEAIDSNAMQTSGEINYTTTSPVTNLANIISCNDITEFITYQIDNNPPILHASNVTYEVSLFNILVNASSQNGSIAFILDSSVTVNTPIEQIILNDINGDEINQNDPINITYTITAFGGVGEYIDANFSGIYLDEQNVTHTIDGAVHMIRDF